MRSAVITLIDSSQASDRQSDLFSGLRPSTGGELTLIVASGRLGTAAIFAIIEKGAVKIEINQRYKLADIVQAHTDLEAGRASGSTIITP